ncbi:hypothetical protein BDV06DRAFT_42105 [Aspergillus oleicola]
MLKALFHPPEGGGPSYLGIIIVPAAGLARPSEWVDISGRSWLRQLFEKHWASPIGIWEFEYNLSPQNSLAERLVENAHGLLTALLSHCTGENASHPLVFICHGMGGIVFKKALCISREQHFKYRPVIDVISGAIFLGSPHLRANAKQAKITLDLLLRCQNRGTGRSIASDNDILTVMDICRSFERVNLRVPVISVYENHETQTERRVFAKFFNRRRNSVVTTKDLCRLNASPETVLASDSDHFDVCKVASQSRVYKAIVDLLEDRLQNAPRAIAELSKPYTVPPGLRDDTLRSQSTAGYTRFKEQNPGPVSSPIGAATGGSTAGSFELVPRLGELEITTRDPILPCFSLGTHKKADSFYGREDVLAKIDKHLLFSSEEPVPESDERAQLLSFSICGLGGMGKTELAVEYAYTRREYFEAIFWLSADDGGILAANFAKIAQQLGLEDDTQDLAASRDIVMGWLAHPLRKIAGLDTRENEVRWLIIFDNVDNLDVLHDYWPKLGRGSVLVTSRDPAAKTNLFTGNGIDLPPLSTSESEALMQRLTHLKAEGPQQEALSCIAEKLGGLPLAIHQMSGIFRQLRLSYIDFLNYYNEEGIQRLQARTSDKTESEHVRSLATTWALDRLSPQTRALLQVICLLDPDGIPEVLLIDKTKKVELKNYPRNRGEYYDARAELLSSSLINQNADQGLLSLHRLIQETTRGMMNETDIFEALRAATQLVVSTWPFQSLKEHHSVARFDMCETIFPCVLRLKNAVEPYIGRNKEFPLDIRLADLFNDTGWYMFERGLLEEVGSFCTLALQIGEGLGDTADEEVVRQIRQSHSFLGIAMVETNQHDSSLHHKQIWLDMLLERRSSEGKPIEDYELGYAYNEIGVAYGNRNMLEEAAGAFLRSIEIFQGLDDYEDTMLGWPEPNLGFIYWMQGRFEEAERTLVEILDIHAAAWGVDDTKSFKTGKILYGMGNVLEDMGRYEESLNFHSRCLAQYRKTLGMNHHRMGDICYRMAGHCMRQGAYKEAE